MKNALMGKECIRKKEKEGTEKMSCLVMTTNSSFFKTQCTTTYNTYKISSIQIMRSRSCNLGKGGDPLDM